MKYPSFFNNIESIVLKDDLANFLGAVENGIIEFNYIDIVKSAGHSCATVAGAYLMCMEGLKALYKNETAKRGEIQVEFKENSLDGVAGVISNVITQITGATETNGFKGIAGNFVRHGLISFNADINSSIKLTRIDTEESVEIIYDPSGIQPNPQMFEIFGKFKNGVELSTEELKTFGILWQERVGNIFNNIDKVITVTIL